MSTQITVLFDGECGMCTGSARFVSSKMRPDSARFVARQSTEGHALCIECGIDPNFMGSMVAITEHGPLLYSDGALEIARHMRYPWRALCLTRVVPRVIRDAAYRWIARNRYRFGGKVTACATLTESANSPE